jgi:hypothetical protein
MARVSERSSTDAADSRRYFAQGKILLQNLICVHLRINGSIP